MRQPFQIDQVTCSPESCASAVGYKTPQCIQRCCALHRLGFYTVADEQALLLRCGRSFQPQNYPSSFPYDSYYTRYHSPSIVSGRAYVHIEILCPNDALIVVMGWVVCYVRPFAMNESPSSFAYVDPSPIRQSFGNTGLR